MSITLMLIISAPLLLLICVLAVAESWSYLEFLSRLLEDEVERRGSLNSAKTLEGFGFLLSPAVNRQQVLQLATCDFLRKHRNVLIFGPTGVGNTITRNYPTGFDNPSY